jgi:hypothetical protein
MIPSFQTSQKTLPDESGPISFSHDAAASILTLESWNTLSVPTPFLIYHYERVYVREIP